MILAVDASTLVAELVRARGRRLFRRADLHLLVAEEQWAETVRGLERRFDVLRQRIGAQAVETLRADVNAVVESRLQRVPRDVYAAYEVAARRRVRDTNDWPTVALALAAGGAILTSDPDFLGSGVVTWTYATLDAELQARDADERAEPSSSGWIGVLNSGSVLPYEHAAAEVVAGRRPELVVGAGAGLSIENASRRAAHGISPCEACSWATSPAAASSGRQRWTMAGRRSTATGDATACAAASA